MEKIFMAYTTGKTCWAMIFHPDGRVLNVSSKDWVVYHVENLEDYFITYTEVDSSGLYIAEYPSGFESDVLPIEISYQQSGVTPALPDDLPIISIGQSQGSNMASIKGSVDAASNMSESAKSILQGEVQSGSNTSTQIVSDMTGALDDLYRGRVIMFTSGSLDKSAGIIKSYDAGTKIIVFTELPDSPSPGDTFIII